MRILKVNPENIRESEEAIIEAARVMLAGGAGVFPTDTGYGLGVDATNEKAIRKIFKIKQREQEKALSVIVRDIAMAKKVALIDSKIEKSLKNILPGAITVILRKKDKLPEILTAGKETIGLRIPDYKLTHLLCENMGRPFVATSANISGEIETTKIASVFKYFEGAIHRPDLILDAGNLKCSQPSTILDLSGFLPKIVRVGPVSKGKLLEILRS